MPSRTPQTTLLAIVLFTAVLTASAAPAAAQLEVESVTPTLNEQGVPVDAPIAVAFDRALNLATVPPQGGGVRVGGSITGATSGVWTVSSDGSTLTLVPELPFAPGEEVAVRIDGSVRGRDGSELSAGSFTCRFRTAVREGTLVFEEIDVQTSRDDGTQTRIYGAQCTALGPGRLPDLALVSEVTSDVRLLVHRGDASGLYEPRLTPQFETGSTPSPNHAADFDGDGITDLATCNVGGNSVSILIGDGAYGFAPRVDYPVGEIPAGLAVLDVEGDGDMDLATANSLSDDVTLVLNLGDGTFGPPRSFEGGGEVEYGLAAADMNNDGLDDLVVGCRGSEEVIVHLANGEGGFVPQPARPSGGAVWMVVCGDMNGDGNMDVTTANGFSGTSSILFGDGAGGLGSPFVTDWAGWCTATDVGDVDGDGDLDWLTSHFGGGQWRLFENDGAGGMTLNQTFLAPSNPGCALIFDFDLDHDLDLVLLDEIGDLAIFMRQVDEEPGTPVCFGDGSNEPCPCGNDSDVAGEGCLHSGGRGMRIRGFGSTSLSADDLGLVCENVPLGNSGIFFAGTESFANPLLDGLQCTGGDALRFRGLLAETETVLDTDFIGQDLFGEFWVPGTTYRFQFFSRDNQAGPSPCGGFANLSAAYELTLTP